MEGHTGRTTDIAPLFFLQLGHHHPFPAGKISSSTCKERFGSSIVSMMTHNTSMNKPTCFVCSPSSFARYEPASPAEEPFQTRTDGRWPGKRLAHSARTSSFPAPAREEGRGGKLAWKLSQPQQIDRCFCLR
jgi:hypothetical protein